MTITFSCPNPDCRNPFTIGDEFAGKKAKCNVCQTVVTIPNTGPVAVPLPTSPRPFIETKKPPSVIPVVPKQLFCTNCGNSVSEQAAACMSCGASPAGHRKFCRQCGVGLNPEQVVCIKCGSGVKTGMARLMDGAAITGPKSKVVAGLLAILLGGLGAHKFYMGSWGWGTIYLVNLFVILPISSALSLFVIGLPFLILSGAFASVVGIMSLIEGILYLTMSDEAFAAKYPPETQRAFRW